MNPPTPQIGDKNIAPTTTAAEDLVTYGQRRVNLMWESTQAIIAVLITGAVVWCSVHTIEAGTLTNAFFLIVGSYFQRTNHQNIGGVGRKVTESQRYEGR